MFHYFFNRVFSACILVASGLLFALPAATHAATLYYNNATGDQQWTTLGNWWQDASTTIPATTLPTSSDEVFVEASTTASTSYAASIHSADFSNGAILRHGTLSLFVAGGATFHDTSANDSLITGNVIFEDSSANNYAIDGNAIFNDASGNLAGSIAGDATFNDSSVNDETVRGNATFNANSTNNGNVYINGDNTGNAIFNDSSLDNGYVAGDAVFSGEDASSTPGVFVDGTSTREYLSDSAPMNDFSSTTAPGSGSHSPFWVVLADSAVVDLASSTYDTSTSFAVSNCGAFVPSEPNGVTPTIIIGCAPALAASSPTGISRTGATLNASITDGGAASSTVEGFYYGVTADYGSVTSSTGTFGIGAFSQTLTGLVCGTTYHYQAFAVSPKGTGTTSDQTFATDDCPSTPPSGGGGGGGGSVSSGSTGSSVSPSALAELLAPASTTTPIVPDCPIGYVCTPITLAATSSASVTFMHNLYLGLIDPDVLRLQRWLNANGFPVNVAGHAGSPSHETDYFGALTKAALVKFQKAHGIPDTGYFGPITRSWLSS